MFADSDFLLCIAMQIVRYWLQSGAAGQLDMVLPNLTRFDADKRGWYTGRQQWWQPFGVEFWSPGVASFVFLFKDSQMALV